MKSCRTLATATLAALAVSSAPLIAADLGAPAWPANATSPGSTASSSANLCEPNVELQTTFPLVMCVERTHTSSSQGMMESNLMPWTNFDSVFPEYRNQYYYPSTAVTKVAARAVTIESIHSRGVTWSPLVPPIPYGPNPDQWIRVYKAPAIALSTTFASNLTGLTDIRLDYPGPKNIGQIPPGTALSIPDNGTVVTGPAPLSDFIDRGNDPATRNDLDEEFLFDGSAGSDDPLTTNILVDTLMRLQPGAGTGVPQPLWDITLDDLGQGCPEPQRVFGGSVFQNVVPLTTALTIDQKAFVWVFRGKTMPPPATIQQQIAEILRLLVTPEGLRCTGLDLTPNGKANDDPIAFPDGANWDPIPPTVSSGKPETGEEAGDGRQREQGWIE